MTFAFKEAKENALLYTRILSKKILDFWCVFSNKDFNSIGKSENESSLTLSCLQQSLNKSPLPLEKNVELFNDNIQDSLYQDNVLPHKFHGLSLHS